MSTLSAYIAATVGDIVEDIANYVGSTGGAFAGGL